MNWLDQIKHSNNQFLKRVDKQALPVKRPPGRHAIITCMDPRINLEAVGISGFMPDGRGRSDVRIIRSLGGFVDDRSLLVAIHLAGIKEFAVVMHTDCGCCLAWSKVNTIIENLYNDLAAEDLACLEKSIGHMDTKNIRNWLNAFRDPWSAIKDETINIKTKSFVGDDIIVHGLIYHVDSGLIDLVVNGYN